MVAVVNYGMGNIHSVAKALEAVGGDVVVTASARDIERADHIVLPGVGSFAQGMRHLNELKLSEALYEQVMIRKKPFLGICLGMQLVAKTGNEHGLTNGLGWISAKVVDLDVGSKDFKVPHMGWNDVEFVKDTLLFENIKSPATFYFVHSYHFVPEDKEVITGLCDHGIKFVASVRMDNIHLVQFHPEKSQKSGLQVLENFLSN